MILILLLGMGCAAMGPDYTRPDLGIATPPAFQHSQPAPESKLPELDDKWWQEYGDEDLNRMVGEVLQRNWDIKKAASVVLELKAKLSASRADRLPKADLQGTAERERLSEIEADSFSLSLSASYEMDFWGRLARAEEAARAKLLESEENRLNVAQGAVAETVRLYLQMESLERRIQITQSSLETYGRALNWVERRYKKGLSSSLDLSQAARTLAEAQASLPGLMQELGLAQYDLATLLGRYPATRPPRSQPEDYYQSLGPVPAGLPSELLLRRPDLRAAEAALRAVNAQVGQASAARFPRISLTGGLGYGSQELDRLFRPESWLWNIAMGLVQPVFDGGKLQAEYEAAQARYQQQVAVYAKAVLQAFSEVEGALLTRQRQIEKRQRTITWLQHSRRTQRLAQNHYEKGLTDYQDVLNAQQTRYAAELELVTVDLAIFQNRAALHRALGGGWGDPAGFQSSSQTGSPQAATQISSWRLQ